MKNVLIVSGHTDLHGDSCVNRIIMKDMGELLPDTVLDDLSALYPDYRIDVAAEQAKLVTADVIVLQFPIFWYSMPSLLAKWMEDVFVRGFSHGSTGKALAGKKLILSFTTGAPENAYGANFPLEMLTGRFRQTAGLTGMIYEGYVYTGGVSYADRTDPARAAAMQEAAHVHAKRLAEKIATV